MGVVFVDSPVTPQLICGNGLMPAGYPGTLTLRLPGPLRIIGFHFICKGPIPAISFLGKSKVSLLGLEAPRVLSEHSLRKAHAYRRNHHFTYIPPWASNEPSLFGMVANGGARGVRTENRI